MNIRDLTAQEPILASRYTPDRFPSLEFCGLSGIRGGLKLYVNKTSPYVRILRIVINERGLPDRIEVITAETRRPDSQYYKVNPSGRTPYLLCDDGFWSPTISTTLMADRRCICLAPNRIGNTAVLKLGAAVYDGVVVLIRELHRPNSEQSSAVIEHDRQRRRRLADFWDEEIGNPVMTGALNMPQIAAHRDGSTQQIRP